MTSFIVHTNKNAENSYLVTVVPLAHLGADFRQPVMDSNNPNQESK